LTKNKFTFYSHVGNSYCRGKPVVSVYEIQKGVPIVPSKKTGLTDAIRKMVCGDSIVIPGHQISSAHPCAAAVGAKVTTRKNADGTVTVWRVDEPRVISHNIFGDPMPTTDLADDIFK
jgi:hypothetical protein